MRLLPPSRTDSMKSFTNCSVVMYFTFMCGKWVVV